MQRARTWLRRTINARKQVCEMWNFDSARRYGCCNQACDSPWHPVSFYNVLVTLVGVSVRHSIQFAVPTAFGGKLMPWMRNAIIALLLTLITISAAQAIPEGR